ncbi:MAG: hypothetical protein ACK42Z_06025 [Candidatus Kapaibacteriota bacterium]
MDVKHVVTSANNLDKIKGVKQEKLNSQNKKIQQTKNQNQTSKQADKIEISDKARMIYEIENRINNGFYNKAEVLILTSKEIYNKHFKVQ